MDALVILGQQFRDGHNSVVSIYSEMSAVIAGARRCPKLVNLIIKEDMVMPIPHIIGGRWNYEDDESNAFAFNSHQTVYRNSAEDSGIRSIFNMRNLMSLDLDCPLLLAVNQFSIWWTDDDDEADLFVDGSSKILRRGNSSFPTMMNDVSEETENLVRIQLPHLRTLKIQSIHTDGLQDLLEGWMKRVILPSLVSLHLITDEAIAPPEFFRIIADACPVLEELHFGNLHFESGCLSDLFKITAMINTGRRTDTVPFNQPVVSRSSIQTNLFSDLKMLVFICCDINMDRLLPERVANLADSVVNLFVSNITQLEGLEFQHCTFKEVEVAVDPGIVQEENEESEELDEESTELPSYLNFDGKRLNSGLALKRLVLLGFGKQMPTTTFLSRYTSLETLKMDEVAHNYSAPNYFDLSFQNHLATQPMVPAHEFDISGSASSYFSILTNPPLSPQNARGLWSLLCRSMPNLTQIDLRFTRASQRLGRFNVNRPPPPPPHTFSITNGSGIENMSRRNSTMSVLSSPYPLSPRVSYHCDTLSTFASSSSSSVKNEIKSRNSVDGIQYIDTPYFASNFPRFNNLTRLFLYAPSSLHFIYNALSTHLHLEYLKLSYIPTSKSSIPVLGMNISSGIKLPKLKSVHLHAHGSFAPNVLCEILWKLVVGGGPVLSMNEIRIQATKPLVGTYRESSLRVCDCPEQKGNSGFSSGCCCSQSSDVDEVTVNEVLMEMMVNCWPRVKVARFSGIRVMEEALLKLGQMEGWKETLIKLELSCAGIPKLNRQFDRSLRVLLNSHRRLRSLELAFGTFPNFQSVMKAAALMENAQDQQPGFKDEPLFMQESGDITMQDVFSSTSSANSATQDDASFSQYEQDQTSHYSTPESDIFMQDTASYKLLANIFKYLSLQEKARSTLVCSSWINALQETLELTVKPTKQFLNYPGGISQLLSKLPRLQTLRFALGNASKSSNTSKLGISEMDALVILGQQFRDGHNSVVSIYSETSAVIAGARRCPKLVNLIIKEDMVMPIPHIIGGRWNHEDDESNAFAFNSHQTVYRNSAEDSGIRSIFNMRNLTSLDLDCPLLLAVNQFSIWWTDDDDEADLFVDGSSKILRRGNSSSSTIVNDVSEETENLVRIQLPHLRTLKIQSIHTDGLQDLLEGWMKRVILPSLVSLHLITDEAIAPPEFFRMIADAYPVLEELHFGNLHFESGCLSDLYKITAMINTGRRTETVTFNQPVVSRSSIQTNLFSNLKTVVFICCDINLDRLLPERAENLADSVVNLFVSNITQLECLEFQHCTFKEVDVAVDPGIVHEENEEPEELDEESTELPGLFNVDEMMDIEDIDMSYLNLDGKRFNSGLALKRLVLLGFGKQMPATTFLSRYTSLETLKIDDVAHNYYAPNYFDLSFQNHLATQPTVPAHEFDISGSASSYFSILTNPPLSPQNARGLWSLLCRSMPNLTQIDLRFTRASQRLGRFNVNRPPPPPPHTFSITNGSGIENMSRRNSTMSVLSSPYPLSPRVSYHCDTLSTFASSSSSSVKNEIKPRNSVGGIQYIDTPYFASNFPRFNNLTRLFLYAPSSLHFIYNALSTHPHLEYLKLSYIQTSKSSIPVLGMNISSGIKLPKLKSVHLHAHGSFAPNVLCEILWKLVVGGGPVLSMNEIRIQATKPLVGTYRESSLRVCDCREQKGFSSGCCCSQSSDVDEVTVNEVLMEMMVNCWPRVKVARFSGIRVMEEALLKLGQMEGWKETLIKLELSCAGIPKLNRQFDRSLRVLLNSHRRLRSLELAFGTFPNFQSVMKAAALMENAQDQQPGFKDEPLFMQESGDITMLDIFSSQSSAYSATQDDSSFSQYEQDQTSHYNTPESDIFMRDTASYSTLGIEDNQDTLESVLSRRGSLEEGSETASELSKKDMLYSRVCTEYAADIQRFAFWIERCVVSAPSFRSQRIKMFLIRRMQAAIRR
ncbi:hypothetical protein HK098_004244 [Nowakowskiella sp. JEL0407]|nr:hypothetical protein HK098_004244 [Nowakowskiella sp. JEL0407]